MTDDTMVPSERARRDEIRRIGHERFEAAAATLAQAYRHDALVWWTLGADLDAGRDLDDAAHRRYWRGLLAGLGPGAEVHATYDVDGVVVWRPSRDSVELVALAVDPGRAGRDAVELPVRLSAPMYARVDRLGLVVTACVADATPPPPEMTVVGSERRVGDGPPRAVCRRDPR